MSRRARLSLPGIPWHVIQRGHNRSACFFAETDYLFYLHYLQEFSRTFDCAVHAYVLMSNHVHLLLTPERTDSVALLMKNLGQRYVQDVNRSHRRTGTLWEGRFRSCLTQTETYLLTCHRYVELNPVRAGMVARPQDYRWSSYRCNALGEANTLITPHDEYRRLGRTPNERQIAYRALFRGHISEAHLKEIRDATHGNFVLGGKAFQSRVADKLGTRVVRASAGRPPIEVD